jgi:hypothetical protein
MISASTRFLAQPREIKPTRVGFELKFFFVTVGEGYQRFAVKQSCVSRRATFAAPNYFCGEFVETLSTFFVAAGATVSAGKPSRVRMTARFA